MENDLIESLFDHMDELRNLPDYQLERRAEIFFYLFLPSILEEKFKTSFKEPIIPEFPVKIDLIKKEPEKKDSNHSIKIDYFAITNNTNDARRAFFIELKTDGNSIDPEQSRNLLETCNNNLSVLLDGVLKIAPNSSQKRKYLYLISRLAELDLFDKMPNTLDGIRKNDTLHGMSEELRKIVIKEELEELMPEPVYILPNNKVATDDAFEIITFEEVRKALKELQHPIPKRFVTSLEHWDKIEAGKR